MPTLITRPRSPNPAWLMIQALQAEPSLDAEPYLSRFYDAVSECSTTLERDALIVKGFGLFGFTLADALREVEARVLERMAAPQADSFRGLMA